MRSFILGFIALSLSACSMGGVGYGTGHSTNFYGPQASTEPSVWQTGHINSGFTAGPHSDAAVPCATRTAMPVQPTPCAQAAYVPPVPPCHQPQLCVEPAAPHFVSLYGYGGQANGIAARGSASYRQDNGAYGRNTGYSGGYFSGHHAAASSPQGHFYTTLGVNSYDVARDIYGAQGRFGYQIADNLGAEIEGSLGLNDEDADTAIPRGIRVGVDWQLAAFARASLPIGQRINLFARGGYHRTNLSSDLSQTQQFTFKEDGLAYGAGAELNLTPVDAIRADYTVYELDGPANFDSVSLAYLRRF